MLVLREEGEYLLFLGALESPEAAPSPQTLNFSVPSLAVTTKGKKLLASFTRVGMFSTCDTLHTLGCQ